MKRSEFFSEMGKGFLQTVKEVASPFVSGYLEKLDTVVDELAGVKWHEVGSVQSLPVEGIHDLYIKEAPVSIICEGKQFTAFQKACPTCKTMLQWIAYEKKFKCFLCDEEYHVDSDSDDMKLRQYPLKEENGKLYIGIS
ncbi:Rieske (2Fe-2S) protein [Thermoactinomyces mirandus]|uniref:Rieske (2Fe-2S) protein n=1 Tax=Thermoactinomyces mirandus TaxID=2756294 RepID=A0A7W1XRM0_9BACL|nr:Rieske (2Fe-2S) protein [Thermoactinomyces mirandus]MBA4601826.1 Rieske (2Fe-2S) protein [Thermoactinomyces mirandus]